MSSYDAINITDETYSLLDISPLSGGNNSTFHKINNGFLYPNGGTISPIEALPSNICDNIPNHSPKVLSRTSSFTTYPSTPQTMSILNTMKTMNVLDNHQNNNSMRVLGNVYTSQNNINQNRINHQSNQFINPPQPKPNPIFMKQSNVIPPMINIQNQRNNVMNYNTNAVGIPNLPGMYNNNQYNNHHNQHHNQYQTPYKSTNIQMNVPIHKHENDCFPDNRVFTGDYTINTLNTSDITNLHTKVNTSLSEKTLDDKVAMVFNKIFTKPFVDRNTIYDRSIEELIILRCPTIYVHDIMQAIHNMVIDLGFLTVEIVALNSNLKHNISPQRGMDDNRDIFYDNVYKIPDCFKLSETDCTVSTDLYIHLIGDNCISSITLMRFCKFNFTNLHGCTQIYKHINRSVLTAMEDRYNTNYFKTFFFNQQIDIHTMLQFSLFITHNILCTIERSVPNTPVISNAKFCGIVMNNSPSKDLQTFMALKNYLIYMSKK